MAIYSFKLPDLGEGIAEAEIVAWHAKVGEVLNEDDLLCDMMTDKATVEMTAPVAGKLVETAGVVGDQIAIGSVLAKFEIAGDDSRATQTASAALPAEPETADLVEVDVAVLPAAANSSGILTRGVQQVATAPDLPLETELAGRRVAASPAVRARAKDLGIDLAMVKCAGDHIRHSDLDSFLRYNAGTGYVPGSIARPDEQVRVIGLRRRIAENMAASKRAIPHFTYVEEIDVTKLETLRADLNETRAGRPKLTLLPLLILAICRAIPNFPMLNARYDDEAGIVTRSGAIHLGMATQTDAGLMVPVIRDAQDRNLWQLAAEIVRLADAARAGKATSSELSGSTLTITSLGPLGGVATTPVINRPEVAIIGPNKIVERPIFRDGRVVAAKLMNLSISCDHRVVDGWDAASFVQALRILIETPATLFDSGR